MSSELEVNVCEGVISYAIQHRCSFFTGCSLISHLTQDRKNYIIHRPDFEEVFLDSVSVGLLSAESGGIFVQHFEFIRNPQIKFVRTIVYKGNAKDARTIEEFTNNVTSIELSRLYYTTCKDPVRLVRERDSLNAAENRTKFFKSLIPCIQVFCLNGESIRRTHN